MSLLMSWTFCIFAFFIYIAPISYALESKGQKGPFPNGSQIENGNSPPLDALQLTKGEWKRSIENKSKINPPMPEQADQKEKNMKQEKNINQPENEILQKLGKVENLWSNASEESGKISQIKCGRKNIIIVTSTSTVDCLPVTTTISSICCSDSSITSCPSKCPLKHIAVVTNNVLITEYEQERMTFLYEVFTTHVCTTSIVLTMKL